MRTIGNDLSAKKQNNFIASGTLDNGASVIVNADGTVSSVVQTAFTSAEGNLTEDSSVSGSYQFAACYDSTNKRVVAFYNRSDSLVAKVGSISGTTITYDLATGSSTETYTVSGSSLMHPALIL